MPQKAAPFHQRAFDIAVPERFVGESVTRRPIRDELADHLRSARAILHRHAHFQVAGVIGASINLLAENAEPSAEGRVFAGETRAGANIGQIKNEIVDRIAFVLEAGGNREPLARMKERKKQAAARRCSILKYETELAPGVGG